MQCEKRQFGEHGGDASGSVTDSGVFFYLNWREGNRG